MATTETGTPAPGHDRDLAAELAGLDRLDTLVPPRPRRLARAWGWAWPKVAAILIGLGLWQGVVWTGWRPEFVLPPPGPVFRTLIADFPTIMEGVANTLQRAAVGYSLALVIGVAIGTAVSQSRLLRAAVGSMITGLQTMPSIAWFPLAIVLFQLSEAAIYFVVVLGAAPSIANGIIGGVDHIQPGQLRAGQVLGARGAARLRHIVLPAALPAFVAGLKQGWAFAWRSLLAGELLVLIAGKQTLGGLLDFSRQFSDFEGLIAVMLVILVIGIVIDSCFGAVDTQIRKRYGLVDAATV